MKGLISGTLFLLASVTAALGACPSPNPNISAPPFVDGCPLPASGLNNLATSIATKGNVTAPSTATAIGELASFNNTLGTLLRQGSAQITDSRSAPITTEGAALAGYSQSGITAQQIADWVFCNGCTVPISYDAIRGVSQSPTGTTLDLVNGVAGYVLNQTVGGTTFPVDVVLFGMGISAVNGAKTWGINTVLTDNQGQHLTTNATRYLLNEFDFNGTSANVQITGLQFAGTSFAQPALANGLVFFPLDPTGLIARWNNVLISTDGAAQNFMNVGMAAPSGNNISSQISVYNYSNSSGVKHDLTLTANGGQLFLGGDAGWGFQTASGAGANTNGLTLGMTLASGSNVASQFELFNYFDSSGVAQNYAMRADTNGQLAITGTGSPVIFATTGQVKAGTTFAVGSSVGVTCPTGSPTSSFATVGGIVTHC